MLRLRHSLCALLVVFAFVGYSFDVECLLGADVCPDSCQTQVSDACSQPLISGGSQAIALPRAVVDYVALATSDLSGRVAGPTSAPLLGYQLVDRPSSRAPPA